MECLSFSNTQVPAENAQLIGRKTLCTRVPYYLGQYKGKTAMDNETKPTSRTMGLLPPLVPSCEKLVVVKKYGHKD